MKTLLLCITMAVPRPVARPVDPPAHKICRDLNGVKTCVVLGVFPTNPNWWETLQHK